MTRAIPLLFHDVYRRWPSESGFCSAAADRYKLSAEAFDRQLDSVAAARSEPPVLASDWARPVAAESRESRGLLPFAITFDDGGASYYSVVADRLERRGWRGHCFVTTGVVGTRGFLEARQIRELHARGHVIGSHSASHPRRFSALALEQMRGEWTRSRRALEDLLGAPVEIASVPGGYFSPAVARAADEAGVRVLFTSEPVTSIARVGTCAVAGRFTIRRADPPDAAGRLLADSGWARSRAWLDWNVKGVIKPILGPAYIRLTEWVAPS